MPHNSQKQRRKRALNSSWRDKRQDDSVGHRGRRIPKGRNSSISSNLTQEQDVTLQAFADNANSLRLGGRASKADTMSLSKEVKLLESASAVLRDATQDEVIDDWYERTFSDEEDFSSDEDADETETVDKVEEKTLKSKMEPMDHIAESKTREAYEAHVYPTVIWYLVSAFIYPEDVCTFACLCHDTYALTNTAGFWRKLYFRYWNLESAKRLPKELHHTSIQRTFGLRSLVIRSLQFIYPPFVNRNSVKKNIVNEAVEKMSAVVFMYHVSRRKEPNYVYYLKFQQIEDRGSLKVVTALNHDKEVNVNSNRGQCILKVICKQSHHLEPERIMGKELVNASFSISSGMSYNKLKLEFQEPTIRHQNRSRLRRSNQRRTDSTVLILDPVLCARVYHWWHPLFHEDFTVGLESGGPANNNALNIWNANS